MEPTLFEHGQKFREKFIELLLKDRYFADQILEVFKVSYLTSEYEQYIAECIIDYRKEYKEHPNCNSILSFIGLRLKSDIGKGIVDDPIEYKNLLKRVCEGSEGGENFVRQESINWCRKQNLYLAYQETLPMIADDKSFEEIQKRLTDAMLKGSGNDEGVDYVGNFEERYIEEKRKVIPTGWNVINDLIGGGFSAGDLVIILGPVGAGKTMFLVDFGSAAFETGHNVAHFSLEAPVKKVGIRYDARLTGIPMSDLSNHKEEIKKVLGGLKGRLIIKKYPRRFATVQTMRNFLIRKRQLEGFIPDIIIVDYMSLISPIIATSNIYHDAEIVSNELQGLGEEFEAPVISADQLNRSGFSNELNAMNNIAGSFAKSFAATFVATISRTV